MHLERAKLRNGSSLDSNPTHLSRSRPPPKASLELSERLRRPLSQDLHSTIDQVPNPPKNLKLASRTLRPIPIPNALHDPRNQKVSGLPGHPPNATRARGSALAAGARLGLQNRWGLFHGGLGGFDSRALPPISA